MGLFTSAIGGAVGGAFMGAAIGYFTHRKEKDRHIGRHLLWGAAVGAGLAAAESAAGVSLSVEEHLSRAQLQQARAVAARFMSPQVPAAPVATSGFYPYANW